MNKFEVLLGQKSETVNTCFEAFNLLRLLLFWRQHSGGNSYHSRNIWPSSKGHLFCNGPQILFQSFG